jgi:hypothetical protein
MLWSLLKERPSMRGVVDFYDTGKTFEADDPHAYLVALQEKDGCSYSAQPAEEGMGAGVARVLTRMVEAIRRP